MLILAAVIGLGVGIVVGVLGAGGGILAVPILVYILGQTPHNATAESLVIVGLTAAIAMITRWKSIKIREAITFGLIAIIGSIGGSRLSPYVDDAVLIYMFSALLLVVGIVMIRKGIKARKNSQHTAPEGNTAPQPLWVIALAALGTGTLTGFFGVGGGFVVVPVLVLVLGMPIKSASSTSLLIMVMTSISGLLARIGTPVSIDWVITMAFGCTSMIGGFLGGPLSKRLPSNILTMIFGYLLVAVAVSSTILSW